MSALRDRVQSADLLQSQRAALVLHHTLKELSTKRLGVDQKNFAQVSRCALVIAPLRTDGTVTVTGCGL